MEKTRQNCPMHNKKSLATIFIFILLSCWVMYISLSADTRKLNNEVVAEAKMEEISEFDEVHYFRSTAKKPDFELTSQSLEIINQNLMKFIEPQGVLFQADRSLKYSAKRGNMNQKKQFLTLSGDVSLKDKLSDYKSEKLTYDGQKKLMHASGGINSEIIDEKTRDIIKISSEYMSSDLNSEIAVFTGDVKGQIQRRRRYEGGVKFQSELMAFNSPKSQISLDNYVEIRRNNYYLTAGRAEIFLENFNKKLKYYTLYDDVKLEERINLPSGKSQLRRAFAEKLEARQREGKVILTGAPRVEQGKDIIKGYQITLKENVELVEVDDAKSSFSIKRKKDD